MARAGAAGQPVGTAGHRIRLVVAVLALAVVLAGLVPLGLVLSVPDTGRSSGWLLTLPLTVYAGLRLAVLVARGRPVLFDFFFLLFTYIFMGIAPTVQIRSGEISRTTDGMDYALDLPTAGLVWLGVGCYEVGRLTAAALARRRGRTDSDRALPVATVSPLRSALLVLFGLLASGYFLNAVGIASVLSSRETAFAARNAAFPEPAMRSIFYALAIYPLLVGVGAMAQLRRSTRGLASRAATATMIGAAALLLVIVNPISSARYSMGTVFFAIAVYAGATTTVLRTRLTLAATIGGFVFLFPLADAFRLGDREANVARAGFFEEYAGNPDYDAFWQVANAYSYTVDGLVEIGRQALGVVFFWVPRALWPDKPVDTGILLAQYRGYDFDNLSAPLWAEFLVNGGVWFLVLGFLLTGYLLRRFDQRLLPAFAGSGFWAIVGAIFPVYMTILLRGSMLQATGAVVVALACLVAVYQRPADGPGQVARTGPVRALAAGPPATRGHGRQR